MVIARLLYTIFPAASVSWRIKQLGGITSRSIRTHRPRRSPGRDVKLRDAPRDGICRYLEDASS